MIINGLCSLGPLVGKVKECQVETMVDTLCSNMVSNKEQLRDISSMGLKTVIAELPPASTGNHGNTVFSSIILRNVNLIHCVSIDFLFEPLGIEPKTTSEAT